MALKKPLLLITQDVSTLPFDLKDFRTIPYDRNELTATLREPLASAIRATLGEHVVPRAGVEPLVQPYSSQTIAVTGSMEGDRTRCQRRVEALLAPHVGRGLKWLCGSYGVVDEVVIEFLVGHGESVSVVGYHAYDVSDKVRQLLQKHQLGFVDARREQVPKGVPNAPSDRDSIFLAKADLVVLLWNGTSSGTKRMIEWYSECHRDHVVGFI